MANIAKFNIMNCHLGEIHTRISEEDFSQRIKLEGGTYRECLQQRIPFPYIGVELKAGSVAAHRRGLHGA